MLRLIASLYKLKILVKGVKFTVLKEIQYPSEFQFPHFGSMLSQVLKQVDKHPATKQKETIKQESYRNQSEDVYFFFLLKRCHFILKDISMFKQKPNKRA